MLKANNLKIEYSHLLFENVSFLLGNNERVGLIGLNGCGKSTLLKIITGEEQADQGSVEINNEKIGYLPQKLDFDDEQMVGEYLESLVSDHYSQMWKVETTLAKLGLKITGNKNKVKDKSLQPIDFYALLGSISEGQKLKLYLCKLILHESTVLLLDEPTNHLDIEGINWLEGFLANYDGIIITISHDRLFLNNLIDTVFEIDEGKLNIFTGNYDEYKQQKYDWIQKRRQEHTLQEVKRKKLEDRLKLARKITDGKKRGAAVKAAKKRIEREVKANEIDKYKRQEIKGLSIDGSIHKKKTMIKVENLEFGYTEEPILANSDLIINGQDKVWFHGPNGIGKSTLIKLITGHLSPNKGIVQIGENVNWDYFSQDQSHLPDDMSVREYAMQFGGVDYGKSFGFLDQFLFPKKLQNSNLETLSPGQRARLSFAMFTIRSNELLILDEPTNHLDIETKETIEESLYNYKGTILLISHDRYFVEQIGINRMFTLEGGRIVED